MNVATVARFQESALIDLHSLPDEARQAVIERAKKGDTITRKVLKESGNGQARKRTPLATKLGALANLTKKILRRIEKHSNKKEHLKALTEWATKQSVYLESLSQKITQK